MSKLAFIRPVASGPKRGAAGFFEWLARKQPKKYRAIMDKLGSPELSGLGVASPEDTVAQEKPVTPSLAQKISDIAAGLSQAYLGYEQVQAQKKLFELNLKRAQQGLPMVEGGVAAQGFTGPQVNVGVSSDVKTLLIYGGIGAGLLYLLTRK